MAAHIDKEMAIKKATLELIERDAIMRSWLEKDSGERIEHHALDSSWRRRIKKMEQQGRAVDIVDLSHDGVVIINVIIRSPDGSYPFFVNGSSASDTSFNEALSKAFDEAELGLLEAANQDEAEVLEPESVRSPADHGKLYLHDTHKDAISWLWAGPLKNTLPQATSENIVRQFRPFILEYTKDSSPIHVVRAICPQLVPINFGFGNEHYTHISVHKDSRVRPTIPHYFA
jgi:ribosomal protein S12 methylthiotransferase accessory factor YcaO